MGSKEKLQNYIRCEALSFTYILHFPEPIGGLSLTLMSALKLAYYAWK